MALDFRGKGLNINYADDKSIGETVVDFATHGISASALSAGVSIANTGIALANTFGADVERIDAYNVLQNIGADETADYYQENRAGLDAVGFIAGSIIPGMSAIKALRAAQKTIGASATVSTGLRKALVPETGLQSIAQAIKTSGKGASATLKEKKLTTIMAGFHQQALEAAAFEGAVLLTMNQAPSLTKEDLGYFEGIWDARGAAGFGLLFGTGLGGIFQAVSIQGAAKRMLKESELIGKSNVKVRTSGDIAKTNIIAGDAALEPMLTYMSAKSKLLDESFSTLEAGVQSDIKLQARQSKENLQLAIKELTQENTEIGAKLFNIIDQQINPNKAAANLSGVTAYKPFYEKDILFDVPVSQVEHLLNDDYVNWLVKASGMSRSQAIKQTSASKGMAIEAPFNVAGVDGVRGVSRISADNDWDNIFTWRHETGHTLLTEPIRTLKTRSKLGGRLMKEGEELSRIARPREWGRVDMINEKIAEGGLATKREIQHLEYMQSVDELFADSYAMITNPKVLNATKENFPDLYKFMVGNRALAAQFKLGKSALDTNTGQFFENAVTPTAADLGAGMRIEGKFVVYGQNERVLLDTPFDVDKLTWQEASALNSMASTRDDIIKNQNVDWLDIPRLTAAKAQGIPVTAMKDGAEIVYDSIDEALLAAKLEIGQKLTTKSRMVETRGRGVGDKEALEGTLTHGELGRYIDTGEEFTKRISGMRSQVNSLDGMTNGIIDTNRDVPFWSARDGIDPTTPTYAMLHTDRRAVQDSMRLKGLHDAQQRINIEREAAAPVHANYFKQDYKNLPDATYVTGFNLADNITSVDTSSGLVTSANAELLSGQSLAQQIGKQGEKIGRVKDTQLHNTFDSLVNKLGNDQDAIYEASVLDTKLRQQVSGNEYQFIPETFDDFLVEEGLEVLEGNVDVLASTGIFTSLFQEGQHTIWANAIRKPFIKALTRELDNEAILELADSIQGLAKQQLHTIQSDSLGKFWRLKVKYNGDELVQHKNALSASVGGNSNLNPKALHAGIADTSRYPHHALVVSKSRGIMSNKDTGMIVAHDSTTLQAKILKVQQKYGDDVEIHTNKQIEKNKKILDEYDSTLLFRDSMMDSSLRKNGIFWDVTPEPNPQLFNQYVTDMSRQHKQLIRGMMESKYSEEIGTLRNYSEGLDMYNSRAGKNIVERNAYRDTENLMLNKRPEDPNSLWNQINTVTEQKISNAFYTMKGAVAQALNTGDWEKMNGVLKSYGMDEMYSEANKLILHNIAAPEPFLRKITAKMNSAIGTMMLRMDFAHGIVNVASLPIMLNSEMNNLARIVSKDRLQVLNNATTYTIPGSTTKVPNSGNLMMQAMKNYFSKPHLIKKYREQGHLSTVLEELTQAQGELAGIAKMSDPGAIDQALTKILNTITAPTDASEQFVKFIAANVADMVTDTLRIPAHMKQSTINTFVSRTHGNYTASQRPDLFQGWMGQTIGLFQTYQFNLMQSLFSNVASGNKTAVAKMVGLQAGIFGAQSIPGFQLLNEHIGERSLEDNDFYKVSGELIGNELSNFLMYGTASSATMPLIGDGIDLYSRGDLTPRTPILIPTSPSEVPAISITANFLNSIINTVSKIGDGAPLLPSMLDVLGHSGFNRPLQGIAQLVTGERTTGSGNLLATYQGWDTWNAITKVMGTKTLSEAVAVSSFYRTSAYQAYRSEELQDLGEAYKQSIRAGADGQEEYFDFMGRYTARGGNPDAFNSWSVRQHSNATESQINKLRERNNSPEGRYLQGVMGSAIEDYTTDFGGIGVE